MSRGERNGHSAPQARPDRHRSAAMPLLGHRPSVEPLHPPESADEASADQLDLPDRLLSPTEVAAIFGRTTRVLWTWEQQGILMPIRINTRRLYRPSDIEALINNVSVSF